MTETLSDMPPRESISFNAGDVSPVRMWKTNPLLRRKPSRRQKAGAVYSALGGGAAASDMFSYPRSLDCVVCHRLLGSQEAKWRTGMCNNCWDTTSKLCKMCNQTLPLKMLQWKTELCKTCYNGCEKECAICRIDLANGQLHWGTGICDKCYNQCERVCKLCQKPLEAGQLRWNSGLCDPCYNSCQKTCKICHLQIKVKQVRWNTGICNACYDDCQKTCTSCSASIPLGSMHYRTGLCDGCYDSRRKLCTKCNERLTIQNIQRGNGMCDNCFDANKKNSCKMCKKSLEEQPQHWGTGLCNSCYDDCQKDCKLCVVAIPFGQLHWASGLCDICYNGCEKECRRCKGRLPLGQVHWGTGLCDGCFDNSEKTCRNCKCRIAFGELNWGTGWCNACYDSNCAAEPRRGINMGVRAVIGAQLVFYLAPSLLQPNLFLQIKEKGYVPSAATVYAAVLTTASVVAMLLPAPLGLWAECQGERQVYVGVSLCAVFAAAILLTSPPAAILAMAWAVLNGPPAVRGVRAAYFAKHVPPEDLSWAGQMASSVGLIGGFLGPFGSMLAERWFGDGSDGAWCDGFTGSALFALASSMACTLALAVWLPGKSRRGPGSGMRKAEFFEECERCSKELHENEKKWSTALCDRCWDNYAGDNYSFKSFRWKLLLRWCSIASLLEFSMNAGILATFQPVVVNHFSWGSTTIASVTVMGTGLSVVISLAMTRFRLQPQWQTLAASLLYLLGVVIFTAQPLRQWRVIVGYLLGIKAQILFMSPFIAIFSTLIGSVRVTNKLTTVLCLAPPCGAALGTSVAPAFVAISDTPWFMTVTVPALVAVANIGLGWDLMEGDAKKLNWGRQWSRTSEISENAAES